jgi:short-subunit dehydrogenase
VPHLLPYCCAKFAATAYSVGMHAALARKGIVVTTIVPGEMRTGSFEAAEFKGRQEQEFSWFSVSDSLPFLSLDAERAARQIVAAVKQNRAERILGLPAQIGARFNGLFPATTSQLLALVDRTLPDEGGAGEQNAPGREVHRRLHYPVLDRLLDFGSSAARRFNEQPAER